MSLAKFWHMADPIDQVIAKLEGIVQLSRTEESRAGYFAALYLTVTRRIKQAVADGAFEDGERMARLDAVFAQRYIDAFHEQRDRGEPSLSWQRSFAGAEKRRPIIVQQLLTGMNAHINLDLGIAAATVAPGAALDDLQRDFGTINALLANMTQEMTNDVASVSPWIGLLDKIGGSAEQEIIRFSIRIARDEAWKLASDLAPLPTSEWDPEIARRDAFTAELTSLILKPGFWLSAGLLVIRLRESNDVNKVMDAFVD